MTEGSDNFFNYYNFRTCETSIFNKKRLGRNAKSEILTISKRVCKWNQNKVHIVHTIRAIHINTAARPCVHAAHDTKSA